MEHERTPQVELELLVILQFEEERRRRREITTYPIVRETGEQTHGEVRGLVGGEEGTPSGGGEGETSEGGAAAA